jgi:very-short-patch-repair endonuclease
MAALVIVDSALAARRVTVAELFARLGTKGSAAARILLTLADANSESPLETIARVLLRVHGLDVQTQVYLDGVGRVDLLVEGVLVVELDGFEHHSDRAHYRNDRRRANALTCMGCDSSGSRTRTSSTSRTGSWHACSRRLAQSQSLSLPAH